MASQAEIVLDVKTTKAERQVKKLEAALEKIEATSSKLLNLDKRILATKRAIRTGSDEAARAAKRRLGILREQRQELVLQKRELGQIAATSRRAGDFTPGVPGGSLTAGLGRSLATTLAAVIGINEAKRCSKPAKSSTQPWGAPLQNNASAP